MLNAVTDCGVPTDGVTDAAPRLSACLQKGKHVILPPIGGQNPTVYILNSPVEPSSGSHLSCSSSFLVTLKLVNSAMPTAFEISKTTDVEIDSCAIDGNKAIMQSFSVAPGVISGNSTSRSYIHDLYIFEPLEGIVYGASSWGNIIKNVTTDRSANHGFLFVDGEYNICEECGGNDNQSFLIWITGREHHSTLIKPWTNHNNLELVGTEPNTHNIIIYKPRSILLPLQSWAAGFVYSEGSQIVSGSNVYTAVSSGRGGSSAPKHVSGNSTDGGVNWAFIRRNITSGDNCISIVGSFSSIIGGECEAPLRSGVGIYGNHNTIKGMHISNVGQLRNFESLPSARYYAIENDSQFGGISRNNIEIGNQFADYQKTVTTFAGIYLGSGYASWEKRKYYPRDTWVKSAGNIYYTKVGGLSGATAPTHDAGMSSDGGVSWQYLSSHAGSSVVTECDVLSNRFGNTITGQDVIDFGNELAIKK